MLQTSNQPTPSRMHERVWFMATVLLVMILDEVATLLGQSSEYWTDHSQFNEAFPFSWIVKGPWWFTLQGAAYAVGVMLLLYFLPKKFSLYLGLLAFIGHAWGSSSWIWRLLTKFNFFPDHWYWASLIYFALIAIPLSLSLNRFYKRSN